MNETNYINLIAKLLTENISVAEKETLFTWLEADEANSRLFEEAKVLWKESENYGEELKINTTQAWNRFENVLEEEVQVLEKKPIQPNPRLSIGWKFFARAAAILLLLGMTYWWTTNNKSELENLIVFQTQDQEQKELKLPDGSSVWLNENSSLSYPAKFENRLVQLTGEALFDIVKKEGKNFEIKSGPAKTTVLGTSFNVRAYPIEARIEVTVIRGKVALAELDRPQKIFLEAGDAGILYKKESRLTKNESINENATAWKTGNLVFQDQKMSRIFEDLERHFDVKIKLENKAVLNCSFTGTFEQKQLDDILRFIQLATGIEFERKGNEIFVKGEAC